MPLESLQPDARPSVKRGSVEVSEKNEAAFDVAKDVKPEKIESVKKSILEYRDNKDWGPFLEMARNFLILFPERKNELGLTDEMKTKLSNFVEQWGEVLGDDYYEAKDSLPEGEASAQFWGNITKYMAYACSLKMLYPDIFKTTSLKKKFLTDHLEENIADHYFGEERIFEFNIIMPGEIDKFSKDGQLWELAWKRFQELQNISADLQEPATTNMLEFAATIRTIMPNKYESRIKPMLDLNALFYYLKESGQASSYGSYFYDITYGQILAADKVKVTEEGVKITIPRGKAEENIPPVPQIKK